MLARLAGQGGHPAGLPQSWPPVGRLGCASDPLQQGVGYQACCQPVSLLFAALVVQHTAGAGGVEQTPAGATTSHPSAPSTPPVLTACTGARARLRASASICRRRASVSRLVRCRTAMACCQKRRAPSLTRSRHCCSVASAVTAAAAAGVAGGRLRPPA